MRTIILLALAVSLVSGCSTMTPARYSVSADTNQMLKKMPPGVGALAPLGATVAYDANCRLMGPIHAGDGLTIPEFVTQAINDELKFADRYDPSGAKLSGEMTRIGFSSTSGLTRGWWDLGLTVRSSAGGEVSVDNRYEFDSGFDAITACNQTAQALGAATQDLVKKLVAHPGFAGLLRN